MEVDTAYLLTKLATLHDQESYFVPSRKDVSSNYQKEYFLRKIISNVKLNKILFMKSYKITETEVDWKSPSSIEMRKYVTELIKTKELNKNLGYIINETTFEEDTSLAKNSETIEKSV